VEEAAAACKKAIEDKDSAKIKTTMETLTQASHKMAEAMYKAASPEPEAGSTGAAKEEPKSGEKKDDNVVDAEFEESRDS
jgi:molecular chaperone DnaK